MQQHHPARARYLNLSMRTALSLRIITSFTLAFSFFITPFAPVLAQEATAPETASTPAPAQTPAADEQAATTPESPDTKGKKPDDTTPDTTTPTDTTKDDKQKEPKKPTEPTVATQSVTDVGETSLLTREAMRPQAKTNVDVSTGALEYVFPIDAPPGRSGLTPDVVLSYHSRQATVNGPFGYGWTVNIPYIERLNKRGTNQLYTDTSFYSLLDGELVAVNATTYKARDDNGAYRTYIFSNNIWTVTEKNGTTYSFGATASF